MQHREVMDLMAAIAPVIRDYTERAFGPVVERLLAVEARVAALADAGHRPEELDEVRRECRELTEQAIASLPAARDGKDADENAIAERVEHKLAGRIEEMIPAAPELPDIGAMVERAVREAVAEISAPKDGADGKDADLEAVAEMIRVEVERATPALPDIPAIVAEAIAALPKAKDGKDGLTGPEGRPGRDGEPGAAGRPGERGLQGEPGRDGRDGLPGVPGRPGEKGVDGVDGKDGRDGADGKDGLGFEDLNVEYDGERGLLLRFACGELVKEFRFTLPGIIYRGVWKEGAFAKGDAVTWGGSMWIAMEDTSEQPEKSAAWRLAVKRGDKGKDLRPDEPKGPPVVKLPGAKS